MTTTEAPISTPPKLALRELSVADLRVALAAGWGDFRRAPQFGLFFAGVYVVAGTILIQLGAGIVSWTLALSLGFPLVAPFLAVGLYEVSRRLERGEALSWPGVLGVIWRERSRQIPWAGAIIVIYFLFWSFLAHMLFAVFMGPSALIGPPDDLRSYLTGVGLAMVITEFAVGAIFAFLLFAMTVISLPLLLDQEVDFVSAMLLSLKLTRENLLVLLVWAATIAGLTLISLVPLLLGLFIVLPVLGHASWHFYRRSVEIS